MLLNMRRAFKRTLGSPARFRPDFILSFTAGKKPSPAGKTSLMRPARSISSGVFFFDISSISAATAMPTRCGNVTVDVISGTTPKRAKGAQK
eukprot:CAMPEP_0177516826 /NCGR_PEP_ID=MMETSP0369-20130122/45630_1 /TAXON_ID=447022 ORGANISM="Scrippsiella hangoei-like, Strain SHHI-4" /NCGR_SAMPLE_ID=MMETSP0369 /ASSEMBLY_ACC=CAM_ASM_000364 /LENGTH=91 /DNA_ID=CAMNT_0018995755 /DNA_START=199 /DNA_END=474 /DNA_ORIENTATION=+